MQFGRVASMVASEHHQNDGLIIDPKNTGIVRYEGLTIPVLWAMRIPGR